MLKIGEAVARAHLTRPVEDPVLREKLRPDYTIGCKRVTMSNSFYPALQRRMSRW